jgi:uncharacterized membrane protein YfcA
MSVVICVVVGLAIGVTLGAVGGGGGIITIPVLVYLLGQPPGEAMTGSLLVVGVAAAISVLAHHRAAQVRWAAGLVFALVGTIGTFIGARLSTHVDQEVLLLSFALLVLLVAGLMLRPRSDAGGQGPDRGQRAGPRPILMFVTAIGVGTLTGLFGVGGGFAVVPALVIALGFSIHEAAGTSLLVIAVNSGTALVSRLGSGVALDWLLLATLTAAAVAGSLIGARIAGRVSPAVLTKAFAGLLVAVALFTGARSLLALAVPA